MREDVRQKLDSTLAYLYRTAFYSVIFPIRPETVLRKIANCRLITYERLADVSGQTVADVIRACDSSDGCTHYDPVKNRYLVAVNTDGRNAGRILWTMAHELGHIMAGHFLELADDGRPEASPSELLYMEEEADYFAANFLAPFQAMESLRVQSAADIRDWFGLSQTAADRRWTEYQKPHELTELDKYLSWSGVRSSTKKPRPLRKYHPIDVWSDEPL